MSGRLTAMRRWGMVLAVAGVAIGPVAACGQGDPAPPVAQPHERALQYVGTTPEGLGVSVDFLAVDALTGPLREALGAGEGRPRLAVVSVVNDSDRPVVAPSLIAVLPGGGAVPLATIDRALSGRPGRATARGGVVPPAPVARVARGGAATMYMVLAGAEPGELSHINAVFRPGEPHRLEPRRR